MSSGCRKKKLKQHSHIKIRILKPNISKLNFRWKVSIAPDFLKNIFCKSAETCCLISALHSERPCHFWPGQSTSSCNWHPPKVLQKGTWSTWSTHKQFPHSPLALPGSGRLYLQPCTFARAKQSHRQHLTQLPQYHVYIFKLNISLR